MQHVSRPAPVTTSGIAKHGLCRSPGAKTVYASQFATWVPSMPAFSGGWWERAGYSGAATRALPGLRRRAGPSRVTTTSRQVQGNRSDESACPRAGAVAPRARTCRGAARAARGATGSGAVPAARASGGEGCSAQAPSNGVGFTSPGRSEPDSGGSPVSEPVRGDAARALPAGHVQANAQGHACGSASRFVHHSRFARVLIPRRGAVAMLRSPCSADPFPLRPRRRTRRPRPARAAFFFSRFPARVRAGHPPS